MAEGLASTVELFWCLFSQITHYAYFFSLSSPNFS